MDHIVFFFCLFKIVNYVCGSIQRWENTKKKEQINNKEREGQQEREKGTSKTTWSPSFKVHL